MYLLWDGVLKISWFDPIFKIDIQMFDHWNTDLGKWVRLITFQYPIIYWNLFAMFLKVHIFYRWNKRCSCSASCSSVESIHICWDSACSCGHPERDFSYISAMFRYVITALSPYLSLLRFVCLLHFSIIEYVQNIF